MKKVLLLGTFLSSIAMGEAVSVQVQTKLELKDSGIIITSEPDGTSSVNLVNLDHGTPDRTSNSIASGESLYIKTTEGQLPTGINLNIALNSSTTDSNNLVTGGKSPAETIPHTLVGEIKNATNAAGGSLTVTGNTLESTKRVTTTGEALEVALSSLVNKNDLFGKFAGGYTNRSTLSVTVLAN